MTVERCDVDKTTNDDWKKHLHYVRGTDLKTCSICMKQDFYSWNKDVHTTEEDCAGEKQSKERITLALTDIMMGDKLKPLVIGKAQIPKLFAFNLCFIAKQIKLKKKWYAVYAPLWK